MKTLYILIAMLATSLGCMAQQREFMLVGDSIYLVSDVRDIKYSTVKGENGEDKMIATIRMSNGLTKDVMDFGKSHISFASTDTVSECVDLGLSVKWSTKDLYATKVGSNGPAFSYTGSRQYFAGTEDDLVYRELGYPWRSPVKEEWDELMSLKHKKLGDNYRNVTYFIGNEQTLVFASPSYNSPHIYDDYFYDDYSGEMEYGSRRYRPVYAPTPVEKIALKNNGATCDEFFVVDYAYNKVPAIQKEGIVLRYPEYPHLDGIYSNKALVMSLTTLYYRPYLLVGGQYVYGDEKCLTTGNTLKAYQYISMMTDLYKIGSSVISNIPHLVFPTQKAWNKFFEIHKDDISAREDSMSVELMKKTLSDIWLKYLTDEKNQAALTQMESSEDSIVTTDGYTIYKIDSVPEEIWTVFSGKSVTYTDVCDNYDAEKSSYDELHRYVDDERNKLYYHFSSSSKKQTVVTVPCHIFRPGKYNVRIVNAPNIGDCKCSHYHVAISYKNAAGETVTLNLKNPNGPVTCPITLTTIGINNFINDNTFDSEDPYKSITICEGLEFTEVPEVINVKISSFCTNTIMNRGYHSNDISICGIEFETCE